MKLYVDIFVHYNTGFKNIHVNNLLKHTNTHTKLIPVVHTAFHISDCN